MAEEIITPVVIRTQVYLNDSDYFCNKSWTMSYNLNTKSWISFHSYIPNFYIGENNFFYSGLNGCCDDAEAGGFQVVAGVIDKNPPITTTTTTFYPSPTTTSTTTILDCNIDGRILITDCNLNGTGVITVPPTTTTTICQRPSNLTNFTLIKGYTIGTDPEVIFINSLEEACVALPLINYVNSAENTDGSTLDIFSVYANTTTTDLQLNNIVYYGDSTECIFVPDGWYYSFFDFPMVDVYHISGGIIIEITTCDCSTTTSTTTIVPDVLECCGILFSTSLDVKYLNKITNEVSVLNIPEYSNAFSIAMTSDYLWILDSNIRQWDINLSPFSATFNTTIVLPVGFSTGYGAVAKNSNIIIAINDLPTQTVVEINLITGVAVMTTKFSLQTNRVSVANLLYTEDGKLIVVNKDTVYNNYYITQYDYSTGIVEVDINIGYITIGAIFECDCDIYATDGYGNLYVIIKMLPYVLFNLNYNINISSIISSTQVASCVVTSITQDTTTTTTTTI